VVMSYGYSEQVPHLKLWLVIHASVAELDYSTYS
jgi:hypothetical protein